MFRLGDFCAVLLLCSTAAAQPPAPMEVRGVVTDQDTKQPIPGAPVSIVFLGQRSPGSIRPEEVKNPTSSLKTDESGKFRLEAKDAGRYLVWTEMPGYTGVSSSGTSRGSTSVVLSPKAPVGEAHLYLTGVGEISGVLIDEATQKPLARMPVTAVALTKSGGRYFPIPYHGTTDDSGNFTFAKLSPNDYLIETGPTLTGKERVVTKFTEDDTRRVDEDWGHSFWPGGRGEDSATPIPLAPHGSVTAGKLALRKVSYYRVHLKVPESACRAADKLTITEFTDGFQQDTRHEQLAEIPCTSDLLVTGFAPGSYRLVLATSGPRETRQMASIPFFIADKNVEFSAPMATGSMLEGTILTAEGAHAPDYAKLKILMRPIDSIVTADSRAPEPVEPSGKFRIPGVAAVDQRIDVWSLPKGIYVREIRYNGAAIRGGILPMETAAMAHGVTIVLDDKPATLTGTVHDGSNPVARAWVVLSPWPPASDPYRILSSVQAMGDENAHTWQARVTSTDDQGRFQFTDVVPGEYRVVALQSADEDRNRPRGTLERALAAAAKLELSPNGIQNLNLDVVTLR